MEYSWFNGFHKTGGKYSVDAGIRYDFTLDGTNTNTWWAQAEANYFVKENIAVGIFGDYYLGGQLQRLRRLQLHPRPQRKGIVLTGFRFGKKALLRQCFFSV